MSLKQRGEGGSLFPAELSVTRKTLYLDGVILLFVRLHWESLPSSHCFGTCVMKHIYHLQNDKRAEESVWLEIIVKPSSPAMLTSCSALLKALIILLSQFEMKRVLSVTTFGWY